MATYQVNINGQFNDTFEYPFNVAVSIESSVEPLKRAIDLNDSTEADIFTRTADKATVLIFNRGTNDARIRVTKAGEDTTDFLVPVGGLLAIPSTGMSVTDDESAFSSFEDWDEIKGQAMDEETTVEILVIQQNDPAS